MRNSLIGKVFFSSLLSIFTQIIILWILRSNHVKVAFNLVIQLILYWARLVEKYPTLVKNNNKAVILEEFPGKIS